MSSASTNPLPRLTLTQWLVIAIAAIGFLFDTYELLMTPLIGVPAIAELLNLPLNSPLVTDWVGRLLWISALCGGAFGLLGGWLVDRFGRKRVMAASIFLYALSPVAAAFSTSLNAFIFFRCTTFIGVCVEFVAAITWLAELFPETGRKERVLGWTQAAASLGGLLVTAANVWILQHSNQLPALPLPEIFNAHGSWRYLLITGLLPAIPIALLLPFVPESRVWAEKRAAGTLQRPKITSLFSPQLIRTTLISTVLSACAYAVAFGALQLTPLRIAPGLPGVAPERDALAPLQATAKALNAELLTFQPAFLQAQQSVPGLLELTVLRSRNRIAFRAAKKTGDAEQIATLSASFKDLSTKLAELTATHPEAKEVVAKREKILLALGDTREKIEPFDTVVKARGNRTQFAQELGGLVGRILLALLLITALTQRAIIQRFIGPALIALPLTYFYFYHRGGFAFDSAIFLCGLLVIGQFSFFGEYLPKVFPLHLRGTGASFATNVGGRMIGTSAAFLTTRFVAPMFNGNTYDQVALAAGLVGTSVLLIAFLASFFLPDPHHKSGSDNP